LGVLVVILSAIAGPSAGQAPIEYGAGEEIARLAHPEIIESSGLAPSRIRPGVFWTHNDSGDQPRLFAFNEKGEDLGAYPVQGASAADWEDMASFAIGPKRYLLIGDVGDNRARRKSCTLYFVEEPPLTGRPLALRAAVRMDFTYEDGPHNCESVAVDPVRREVLLVTKAVGATCTAYVLPLPRQAHVRGAVARAAAALRIPTAVAMDVSPDGLRAIILTYSNAYEYTRGEKEDWTAAFGRAPRAIPMPRRAQGESICYGLDGRTLYLTSEKAPSPLLRVAPAAAPPAGPAAK
jgi:hypothetical protein